MIFISVGFLLFRELFARFFVAFYKDERPAYA